MSLGLELWRWKRDPGPRNGACLPPAPPSKTEGRNDSGEHTSGPSSVEGRLETTPDAGGTKPVRWQGLAPTRNGYE